MEYLFGAPKTDADYAEESHKALRQAQREARRQKNSSANDQVRTVREIRDKARNNASKQSLRTLAKTYIRQRNAERRFERIEGQFEAMEARMKEIKATNQMGKAMQSVARAMQIMSGQLNPGKVARTLQTIEYQNEKMEFTMERFDETIDGIMAGEDDEESIDEVLDEIFSEVALGTNDKLSGAHVPGGALQGARMASGSSTATQRAQLPVAPAASGASTGAAPTPDSMSDDALRARIEALTKPGGDEP